MKQFLKPIVPCIIATGLLHNPAAAQTLSLLGETDDWRVSVAPYLFLPVTTTGTSTIAGVTADVDLDLSDVLEALNFAASTRFEVWKGDFGLMSDFYYVNLSGGSTVGLPGPGAGTARVDIKTKQGWASVLAGYRFLDGSYDSNSGKRRYTFDAGAGFRYNVLRQEVNANLNIDIGPGFGFQRKLGGTETWFEPVISLRGAAEISERWTLAARADIGGFGVGGDDLQWVVLAGADYRPWDSTSIRIGWQFYGIDFSTNRADGKFAYDVFQTGPYMGLDFRF